MADILQTAMIEIFHISTQINLRNQSAAQENITFGKHCPKSKDTIPNYMEINNESFGQIGGCPKMCMIYNQQAMQ